MTEQVFQELLDSLRRIQGLNDKKACLAATWAIAARAFVTSAAGCLPHLVFVGPKKVPRDRAVSLVEASIKDLLVELTPAPERRGIIVIKDYDEQGTIMMRDLLLRPEAPMNRPVLMGCGNSFFPDSTPALVVTLRVRAARHFRSKRGRR
jgi:hypothetical protein